MFGNDLAVALRSLLRPLDCLGVLAIAWITVFTHARRVARANPIHALRYE